MLPFKVLADNEEAIEALKSGVDTKDGRPVQESLETIVSSFILKK